MELKKYFLTDQNRIARTEKQSLFTEDGFVYVFSKEGKIKKEEIIATSDNVDDLLDIIRA